MAIVSLKASKYLDIEKEIVTKSRVWATNLIFAASYQHLATT
jgi:hypothetical protein